MKKIIQSDSQHVKGGKKIIVILHPQCRNTYKVKPYTRLNNINCESKETWNFTTVVTIVLELIKLSQKGIQGQQQSQIISIRFVHSPKGIVGESSTLKDMLIGNVLFFK